VVVGGVPGTVRLGEVEGVDCGSEDAAEWLSSIGDSGSVLRSAVSSSESSTGYL